MQAVKQPQITKTLGEAVEQAIAGGCTLVQLREKEISSLEFYVLASEMKKITDMYGIPLIINDRIDIAMAAGAAGVHIGQKDIPADIVRKVIGKDMLLGVSAGSVAEAVNAAKAGDDVIWVASTYFLRWENRRIFPQYYFFSCRPSLKASPTLPDTL